jgi:hypothetical protein
VGGFEGHPGAFERELPGDGQLDVVGAAVEQWPPELPFEVPNRTGNG